MKVNKTILVGVLLILLAGIIFISDFLNPLIRPVTYLFLMGSSKGKDVLFFSLFGLFLILTQLIKKDIDCTKYLKISIVLSSILLISGILLEVIFRFQMGIGLNTVFCSMSDSMTSTSILHTHLLKAILGKIITQLIGSFIGSGINTGVGLYSYLPDIAFLIILLIPIVFVMFLLASSNRPWPSTVLLSFCSTCLIIGAIDGGLFATPSLVGICGLYFIYRTGYYINYYVGKFIKDDELLKENEKIKPPYSKHDSSQIRFTINKYLVFAVIGFIILLRFTVAFAGAESEYYTVEIVGMDDNVDFGNITITHINNTTYHVDSSYNEMELINDLKIPLNNSCEYYTVSWNIYSYFGLE